MNWKPASSLRPECRSQCSRRPVPQPRAPNRARDARSASWSRGGRGPEASRSWGVPRPAPGRGGHTNGGDHGSGRRKAPRAPGFLPGMTHGLPSARGRLARSATAGGDKGTTLAPVLASGILSSFSLSATSSQRRESISLFLHPVSINNLIAASAGGHTDPSTTASLSVLPRRRNSSSVRNRSRRRVL